MITRVGFTGTRQGMTRAQWDYVNEFLDRGATGSSFHEGDCVGADNEAFALAASKGYVTHSWPPVDPRFRAFLPADVEHSTAGYATRNLSIVRSSQILLAAPPGTENNHPRSGSWMTIRMARRADIPVAIVLPHGTLIIERFRSPSRFLW
jgi:hypothetical protein